MLNNDVKNAKRAVAKLAPWELYQTSTPAKDSPFSAALRAGDKARIQAFCESFALSDLFRMLEKRPPIEPSSYAPLSAHITKLLSLHGSEAARDPLLSLGTGRPSSFARALMLKIPSLIDPFLKASLPLAELLSLLSLDAPLSEEQWAPLMGHISTIDRDTLNTPDILGTLPIYLATGAHQAPLLRSFLAREDAMLLSESYQEDARSREQYSLLSHAITVGDPGCLALLIADPRIELKAQEAWVLSRLSRPIPDCLEPSMALALTSSLHLLCDVPDEQRDFAWQVIATLPLLTTQQGKQSVALCVRIVRELLQHRLETNLLEALAAWEATSPVGGDKVLALKDEVFSPENLMAARKALPPSGKEAQALRNAILAYEGSLTLELGALKTLNGFTSGFPVAEEIEKRIIAIHALQRDLREFSFLELLTQESCEEEAADYNAASIKKALAPPTAMTPEPSLSSPLSSLSSPDQEEPKLVELDLLSPSLLAALNRTATTPTPPEEQVQKDDTTMSRKTPVDESSRLSVLLPTSPTLSIPSRDSTAQPPGTLTPPAPKPPSFSLHKACVQGDLAACQRHLSIVHADLNLRTLEGMTPLMLAANAGHPDLVRFLLAQPGINATASNPRGKQALDFVDPKNIALSHLLLPYADRATLLRFKARCAHIKRNKDTQNLSVRLKVLLRTWDDFFLKLAGFFVGGGLAGGIAIALAQLFTPALPVAIIFGVMAACAVVSAAAFALYRDYSGRCAQESVAQSAQDVLSTKATLSGNKLSTNSFLPQHRLICTRTSSLPAASKPPSGLIPHPRASTSIKVF